MLFLVPENYNTSVALKNHSHIEYEIILQQKLHFLLISFLGT